MSLMPWSKWFWRDWLSDLGLRQVSVAARGMWMDMLCVAAQSEPYGHVLDVQGRSMTDEGLAKLAGLSLDEATRLRIELESAEIFSRNKAGTIYCRRMVRDAARHRKAVETGRRGGNPNLRKGTGNLPSDKEASKGTENHAGNNPINADENGGHNGTDNDRSNTQKPEARSQKLEGSQNPTTRAPSEAARERASGLTPEDRDWADLRARLMDLFEDRGYDGDGGYLDTNWVETWRASNYDPNLCLTVVRESLSRRTGFCPNSLKYFDPSLAEAHAKVRAAKGGANGSTPAKPVYDWDKFVRVYVETQGQIWFHLGPRPGLSGCGAPAEVIAKYREGLSRMHPDLFRPLQS